MKNDFNYKWSKIFASKRFHNKHGFIVLTPIEQKELLDDYEKIAFEKTQKKSINNKNK